MKTINFSLFLILSALTLNAKVKDVGYFRVEGYELCSTERWEKFWVDPDEENVYSIYCAKKVKFKLYSSLDTLSLVIKANDSLLVHVISLTEGDTVDLLITGVNKFPNTISNRDKLYTLSKLWSEAKYNFVNLDKITFDWDSLYYAYIEQVAATRNDYEYTKLLEKFYAALQDGHTEFWGKSFGVFFDYAPVGIERFDNKLIITQIRKTIGIDSSFVGAEILAISNIPLTAYLKDTVFPYISASTPQSLFNQATGSLTYGIKWQPFIVKVQKTNGETVTLKLKRNGEATRTAQDSYYGIDRKRDDELIKLSYTQDSIAVLLIRTFNYEEYIIKKLNQLAPQISRAKALIVDLRQNGGGSTEVAWELQSHFTKQNYFLTFGAQTRINNGYYRSQGNWQEQYAAFFADSAYEFLAVDTIFVADTVIRFSMPAAVLIGNYTFSAAEDFLVNMYEVPDRPIFIGEPTGGSTGAPLVLTDLPNDSFARLCTLRSCFPYSKMPFCRKGIEPDITVKQSMDDYFNQKDTVMKTTIHHLQKKITD